MTRPLVIAHRGASQDAPEHTLQAYERALIAGSDGVEADVRLTADGHLVCVHDRRVDRTSNVTGVVSNFTLAELADVDFGSWKLGADEAPDTENGDGYRIVTLQRLLELVMSFDRPVSLLVETKHPTRYAGYVEERLTDLLTEYRLDGRTTSTRGVAVTAMSFSEVALRRLRRLMPELPLVYLMERVPVVYRSGQLPRGVSISGPWVELLHDHPRYVQRVHSQGHRVYVWTVDETDDVQLVHDLGVDAIITNRPTEVIAQLRELPS